jgi:hypothetical protein
VTSLFTLFHLQSLLQGGAAMSGIAILVALASRHGVPRFIKAFAAIAAIAASLYLIVRS